MPAGYAPLPNPRSEPDAERELEEAFDEDDDHHTESTPLTHGYASSDSHPLQADNIRSEPTMPGSYDFERDYDYDYPPPGSPPSPSALALPNTIGNTNGRLPTAPVRPEPPRPSFFRRAVGVLLPQHYARLPSEPATSRLIGGGTDNDGVFANVMAKPVRNVAVTNDNGDVIMVPEDTQNELPPVSKIASYRFVLAKCAWKPRNWISWCYELPHRLSQLRRHLQPACRAYCDSAALSACGR